MIAIACRFAANRYHATLWGRHVNEGVAEWPPSPWRMLRALVAVWQRTLPELSAQDVVPVLECLASESPYFHLPPATTGHTRHYMPQRKADARSLIIDSFVVLCEDKPVVAIWPNATLSPDQSEVLHALLDCLTYLGRAESWCSASLVSAPPQANCFPLADTGAPAGDWETTKVLLPVSPLRLKDLCIETDDLRRSGRIDPLGAHWRQYVRPIDCLTIDHVPLRRVSKARPTVVRYAISGDVVPLVTDTLRVAELARRAAMAQYGRLNYGEMSSVLSGKMEDGAPVTGHWHAFYLPADEDGDGYLDHLNLWAPAGFGDAELQALAGMTALSPGGGRPPFRLVFLGLGEPRDFTASSPVFATARAWRTVTPFVLSRHVKLRGEGEKRLVDGPLEQLRREVKLRPQIDAELDCVDYAPPLTVRKWRTVYPLEFHRWRRGRLQAGGAFNVRIHFETPVTGPVALGFGCHFGLGLFAPQTTEGE